MDSSRVAPTPVRNACQGPAPRQVRLILKPDTVDTDRQNGLAVWTPEISSKQLPVELLRHDRMLLALLVMILPKYDERRHSA